MARSTRRAAASNPTDELAQLAIDLDLTALADALPALLDQTEKQTPSFTDFGLAMFRIEVNARKDRRLERSLKRAHPASSMGSMDSILPLDLNFMLRWSRSFSTVDSSTSTETSFVWDDPDSAKLA